MYPRQVFIFFSQLMSEIYEVVKDYQPLSYRRPSSHRKLSFSFNQPKVSTEEVLIFPETETKDFLLQQHDLLFSDLKVMEQHAEEANSIYYEYVISWCAAYINYLKYLYSKADNKLNLGRIITGILEKHVNNHYDFVIPRETSGVVCVYGTPARGLRQILSDYTSALQEHMCQLSKRQTHHDRTVPSTPQAECFELSPLSTTDPMESDDSPPSFLLSPSSSSPRGF